MKGPLPAQMKWTFCPLLEMVVRRGDCTPRQFREVCPSREACLPTHYVTTDSETQCLCVGTPLPSNALSCLPACPRTRRACQMPAFPTQAMSPVVRPMDRKLGRVPPSACLLACQAPPAQNGDRGKCPPARPAPGRDCHAFRRRRPCLPAPRCLLLPVQ